MKIRDALLLSVLAATQLASCRNVGDAGQFHVESIAKVVDTSAPDHEMCDMLSLTAAEVVTYFSVADEVDDFSFNRDAIILPCKYEGTLKLGRDILQWEIYAGGAGYLYRGKSLDKRYLCRKRCCDTLAQLC